MKTNTALVNEKIQFKNVLLIDETGKNVGICEITVARELAKRSGLDLVCISDTANVPVCKIMNYGKYCFEKEKKEKANKKNSKCAETSEVQISYVIQQHDLEVKAKTINRLISKGNYVRIIMRLSGREIGFMNLAKEKFDKFIEEMCLSFSKIRKEPFIDGREIKAILEPK